jgi:hypothetical protein
MAMTIRVYRLNESTGEQTDITPRHAVKPGVPLFSSALPPCRCPRHRENKAAPQARA